MHFKNVFFPIILFMLVVVLAPSCRQPAQDLYLIKFCSDNLGETTPQCGYVTASGDTVIAPGAYLYCFTDTLKQFAIVMKKDGSLIAIDKTEKKLFDVFKYDNGPDYVSDGLFRIIKNGKIGYADTNGNIVIQPRFTCAFSFKNGKAKVALDCTTVTEGEHNRWESARWFYIDKHGNRIH